MCALFCRLLVFLWTSFLHTGHFLLTYALRSWWSIGHHQRPLAIAHCSGLLWSFRTSWSPAVSALLQCLACNCCKAGLFLFPCGFQVRAWRMVLDSWGCVQSSPTSSAVSAWPLVPVPLPRTHTAHFTCSNISPHSQNLPEGRNSCLSVLGLPSCVMLRCGFDPPVSLPREGIFPLDLTWVLTPFPINSFGWEHKLRSVPCTHAFHCMDSKDPDSHVLKRWMLPTKNILHAPSMKTECDYVNGRLKQGHIHKDLTQNGEPQRYSWERRRRRMHNQNGCLNAY